MIPTLYLLNRGGIALLVFVLCFAGGNSLRAQSGSVTTTQSFSYTGQIVTYTVPAGVTSLTIEARGAEGGNGFGNAGKGAIIRGAITVTPGQQLSVLVGEQTGLTGGGGGSFVVKGTSPLQPLIIAGGGGGSGGVSNSNGGTTFDAITKQGQAGNNAGAGAGPNNTAGAGGTNGNGGKSGTNISGAGGGGFSTDGEAGAGNNTNRPGGKAFINGGAGGSAANVSGGFGGGGTGRNIEYGPYTAYDGGGGGGYSGGGGGSNIDNQGAGVGGGGGSYNQDPNGTNTAGANSGNGLVIISYSVYPIRYVKPVATGTGDGTSWANATGDLQSQINIAGAQQVWVAAGRYTTTANGGSFSLKNGVSVYGGFVGSEQNLTDRPGVNPVVGQVSSTTLTTTRLLQAVIYNNGNGLDNTARLDGFVIAGGNNQGGNLGGGIYNNNVNPSLTNLLITGNTSSLLGGGIYNDSSSPVLTNCLIRGNSTQRGGGIYNNNSSPVLINCTINSNTASNQGGGIFNVSSRPMLTTCTISGNTASNQGGGIYSQGGSPVLTNCLLSGNTATNQGGALHNFQNSTPRLINCTLTGNSAGDLGGAISEDASTSQLTNAILFNNGGAKAFRFLNNGSTSLTYSLIESGATGYTSSPTNQTATVSPFTSGTDFTLRAGSQAIDAGDPASTTATSGLADLAGNPRVLNNRIDQGAFEYQGPFCQPIAITQQPVSGSSVCVGSSVTAMVSVTGTNPNYQWYKDGTSLGTAQQSATLTLTNVQTNQSGRYSVVVTGSCNSVTSTAFSLTVNPPPTASLTNNGPLSCSVTSVTLTASGGSTYLFSNGANQIGNAPTATVTTAGIYSVTVSSGNSCSSVASTTVTASPTSPDYQPLVDLYNATNGPGWINKTNWLTGCSPCGWYGVTCTNGRVTGLNLLDNNLVGTIPASLSGLTSLISLEIGNNTGLTGGIPSGLGSLTALQALNLSRTQLGGSIPASLGNLTQLFILYLNQSSLTGTIPESLFALTRLQYFYLYGNQLSGGISPSLSALTSLRELRLYSNQLSGSIPASLSALTTIQELSLNNNQLSGCFPASLSALCGKNVNLANNPGLPGGGDFGAFCASGAGSDAFRVLATASPNPACVGSLVSLSVTAGSSYQWSGPGGFTATTQTPTLTATSSGLYSVTVGNGSPTCSAIASVSVTVSSPVTASLVSSGVLSCTNTSVTLTASPGGQTGATLAYRFSTGATPIGTTNQATVTTAGVYSVTVISGTGCSSVASTAVTGDQTLPTVSITPTSGTLTCASPSLTLTANTSAPTLRWSTGQTTPSITVNASATYSVTATGSNGCSAASNSVLIESTQSVPPATLLASGALSCAVSSVTLTANTGSGLSYRFSPGATQVSTGNTATVNVAGTYSVTVSNTATGCTNTASVSVSQDNSQPTVSINPSSTTLTCQNPSVTLTATTSASSLTWSTGQTTPSISVSVAGTYSVRVSSANGCMAMAQATVTGDQSVPTASLINNGPISCSMTSATLTAGGGGTYQFSSGTTQVGSGPTAIVSSAGIYSVTVISTNGCTATASTTVVGDVSAPVVSIQANPSLTITQGQSTTLTASASGSQPLAYAWSTNQTTPTISASTAGTYSVTVVSSNGCSATASVVVSVTASPVVSGPFAITGVSLVSCTPINEFRKVISFQPRYDGLNGSPVSFSVANELRATTDPGPYTLQLYTDNPTIILRAVQSGVPSNFTYNWLAACNSGGMTPPPTPGNTAPTVVSPVGNQTALLGQAFTLSVAGVFTDSETPNALTLSAANLPAGLNLAGTTVSGTPSATGTTTVILTATDPGNLSATTSFGFTITAPASPTTSPGSFALVGVNTISCTPIVAGRIDISFTPQYTGLDGSPVTFSVANELAPTTAPGPYALQLYVDNPVITLLATQAGVSSRFSYNWLAACQSGGTPTPGNTAPRVALPVSPQSATVGQGYTLNVAGVFTDTETPGSLVLTASGLPVGLSLTGTTISGTPSVSGMTTVTLTARDPGSLSTSTSFGLTVSPAASQTVSPPPSGFSITSVQTLSCVTLGGGQRSVSFLPQYGATTGQAITFSVANELAPTTAPGPYTLRLYTDNPVITLKATQAGSAGEGSYRYNWLAACGSSTRMGVEEPASLLDVRVLGNPVAGQTAEIEISGAAGQAVQLQLVDIQGRPLHTQRIESASALERVSLPLGTSQGVLLLRVSTLTQQQQIKLIRTN